MPTLLTTISRSGWSFNAPGGTAIDRTDITCPFFPGLVVYETSCNDNQRASFDPLANRRSDIQYGHLGEGVYCIDYAMSWRSYPQFRVGEWGWKDVGPEIHDTLNQSPIQPNVLPCTTTGAQGTSTPRINAALGMPGSLRYFMDANAGRGPHRYYDLGPVGAIGEWVGYRLLFNYTSDASKGFIKVWRNGVLVLTLFDATIAKTPAGWFKIANYSREAYVDGIQSYDIAGKLYSCTSEADVPAMPTAGGPPPPPPPPDPPVTYTQAQYDAVVAERDSARALAIQAAADRDAAQRNAETQRQSALTFAAQRDSLLAKINQAKLDLA